MRQTAHHGDVFLNFLLYFFHGKHNSEQHEHSGGTLLLIIKVLQGNYCSTGDNVLH